MGGSYLLPNSGLERETIRFCLKGVEWRGLWVEWKTTTHDCWLPSMLDQDFSLWGILHAFGHLSFRPCLFPPGSQGFLKMEMSAFLKHACSREEQAGHREMVNPSSLTSPHTPHGVRHCILRNCVKELPHCFISNPSSQRGCIWVIPQRGSGRGSRSGRLRGLLRHSDEAVPRSCGGVVHLYSQTLFLEEKGSL